MSQSTGQHDERPTRGSMAYSAVSSLQSRDAPTPTNDHAQVVDDVAQPGSISLNSGSIQNRPEDVDSLQDFPGDWEDTNDTTYNNNNDPSDRLERLPEPWLPLWLRQPTLISMAVSLFILAAAILGLYIASTRNQGLGSASPNDSIVYLWRYLPTTGQFDSTSTLQFVRHQSLADSNAIFRNSDRSTTCCMERN